MWTGFKGSRSLLRRGREFLQSADSLGSDVHISAPRITACNKPRRYQLKDIASIRGRAALRHSRATIVSLAVCPWSCSVQPAKRSIPFRPFPVASFDRTYQLNAFTSVFCAACCVTVLRAKSLFVPLEAECYLHLSVKSTSVIQGLAHSGPPPLTLYTVELSLQWCPIAGGSLIFV